MKTVVLPPIGKIGMRVTCVHVYERGSGHTQPVGFREQRPRLRTTAIHLLSGPLSGEENIHPRGIYPLVSAERIKGRPTLKRLDDRLQNSSARKCRGDETNQRGREVTKVKAESSYRLRESHHVTDREKRIRRDFKTFVSEAFRPE